MILLPVAFIPLHSLEYLLIEQEVFSNLRSCWLLRKRGRGGDGVQPRVPEQPGWAGTGVLTLWPGFCSPWSPAA